MRYRWTTLSIFLLLFQGCSALTDSSTSWDKTDFSKEGISLTIEEHHDPSIGSDPRPALVVKTNERYECANYGIEYHHGTSEETFDLQLLGVIPPEICLTAMGPATTRVPLPESTESWELSIWTGSEQDRYNLQIFEDRVEIETLDADFSELEESRYYLKPEHSLHLQCTTKESSLNTCEGFEEWFVEQLSLTSFEFPENGVNPYHPSESSDNTLRIHRFYTHPEDLSFEEIESHLETYIQENDWDEKTSWIRIFNWKNKRAFSSDYME